MGLIALPQNELAYPVHIIYYFITYFLMTGGAFCFLVVTKSETLKDVSGMINKHPLLTGAMTLFMISLTGLPPTMGFNAKLFIFMDLIRTHGLQYAYLILFGLLMSVVSAFYYMNVVRYMFFEPLAGVNSLRRPLDTCWMKYVLLTLCFGGIVFFGFFPTPLIKLITSALHP